ncbi:Piezo-type mechanosensitive ion channel homolog [Linum perenne]
MGNFLIGFVLPLLLVTAAVLNRSLISLVDLIAFLIIPYAVPSIGFRFRRRLLLLWPIIGFSVIVICSQVVYLVIWAIKGDGWDESNSWWARVVGFSIVHSWKTPYVIYFLIVKLLAVSAALVDVYGNRYSLVPWHDSTWGRLLVAVEHLGLWWRTLQLYAGFNIIILYIYQLPFEFPSMLTWIADFIGLFKISGSLEGTAVCSGVSLVLYYIMLSFVKSDLEEMDIILSVREGNLTERLLPLRHSFFIRESRSGVRHTNVLLRGAVFRTFSINFFTYGFPVSLFALSYWSFHFASLCAFGLLAYVGYIIYAFPSVFRLHRLNGLVLVFILLWAVSTYIFNVAFPLLTGKLGKDMKIWEMIGLWHYSIPGLFVFAQFCLGMLVALGNLVNNSVFLHLSDESYQSPLDSSTVEEEEGTKVLIVATIAWGLRKCSRAIMLAMIFLIAMKPGFVHAVYGLLKRDSSWELVEIAVLACFCAIHNHGFDMLFSFSAIVQHTPSPPVGFSILKAGLSKSVLLTVYASPGNKYGRGNTYESKIAAFLGAIGQKFLTMYRSCGFVVDDPRMLFSYFTVFTLACFKLRADRLSSLSGSSTYRQMLSQRRNTSVWKDLSFDKSMWTFLDYLRVYCYCHLLDLVLCLILITGTLEYDILHLGYLAFALVFFRMRLVMLKKKNKIFKYLRIYNFAVIVLSLAYQSPFLGVFSSGKCETIDYVFEIVGFYKYDYGFRITSRSSIVEIIIYMLVSLQSYMFASLEFDHVARYLEAEQSGAIMREEEKKAAWKTAQLKHIRESEEEKHQRHLQVEKMKSEMLNLQSQLHSVNSTGNSSATSSDREGLRKRKNAHLPLDRDTKGSGKVETAIGNQEEVAKEGSSFLSEVNAYSANLNAKDKATEISPKHTIDPPLLESAPLSEITEVIHESSDSILFDSGKKEKIPSKENPLISAVQLLGDGVSQVQSIGNQAVNNLITFLNISHEDLDSNEHSGEEEGYKEQKVTSVCLDRTSSIQSDTSTDATSLQIGRILCHIWSQMQSNNDIVCYCCFVIVFLWNFSLLSMGYLAALFLYALCVNTGPSYIFWVIMLIYTEVYILLEYMYQIIIQHCGFRINLVGLRELGFPAHKIESSFVISSLPLFLVYLFTLLQSSITAKDGLPSVEFKSRRRASLHRAEATVNHSLSERAMELLHVMEDTVKLIARGIFRYWGSLTQGAESPPYLVQVSMDVHSWPEDGIQPEKIESGINQLLKIIHDERCKANVCPFASRVHVQSIETSQEDATVALVVFEVVYASPLTSCASAHLHKSLTPAADVAKEIQQAKDAGFVEEIRFPYPILSVIGGGKREIDLYAYVFGADLSVFFLVAMFYQPVIKNKSEIIDVYQLEDQFPKEFVFILMVVFFLIVLDRIVYLCSFAAWKLIFYIFNLVLFTYSVTEFAWNLEPSQEHSAGIVLRAIFLAKAVSLALQAIQIRHGLPHKSTLYQQFLTSKVTRINYIGYRLYRSLPFLYELRCVLDWSCTTTSLTMYDWLKLEDIHASLYLVKCDAVLNRATHRQGDKQTKWTKCCNGICLFFILLCVIWAPMLIYSSGNPTNIANPIKDARVQIDIKTYGGRLTLYQTTLCEKLDWERVNSAANLDPHGYLDAYSNGDIQLVCCQPDSSVLWLVPDVVQNRFIQSLDWEMEMDIVFIWVLTRDRPKGKEVVRYERVVDPLDLPSRSDVQKVLNGSANSFRIYNVYPRYFRVTGSGDVRPFEQEVNAVSADLILNRANFSWWMFYDINSTDIGGCGGLTGPTAVIVSEETPPQGILGDTISKFSIWGLYITFVLAVGRFIRLQCSDLRMRIPYENLPTCDRLIAICEDIYAARAEGELGVEEVLYWTLVKIYRSPHMLLEYTKPD